MGKEPSGRATDKLVPSRATISVITANVPKARYNLVVGLNSASGAGGMPADVTFCKECSDLNGCRKVLIVRFWSISCSWISPFTTIAD